MYSDSRFTRNLSIRHSKAQRRRRSQVLSLRSRTSPPHFWRGQRKYGILLLFASLSQGLYQTSQVMRRFGKDALELHDPLAVWCAICNPPVENESPGGPGLCDGWVAEKRRFQIERSAQSLAYS